MSDVEPVTVASETWVVAHVVHTCTGCHEPILPGERHSRWGVLHEGSWDTYRFHALCRFLMTTLCGAKAAVLDEAPWEVEFQSFVFVAWDYRDGSLRHLPVYPLLARWWQVIMRKPFELPEDPGEEMDDDA